MSDRVLEIERLIAAPPERVFELWTEPELVVRWWGPEGFDTPASSLDLREGGQWRTTMRSPEGKLMTVSGAYRKIEPPRLLSFTWGWEDEAGMRGHETLVTVRLDATPGGTKLRLRQETFQTKEACDQHTHGWASALNRLEKQAE